MSAKLAAAIMLAAMGVGACGRAPEAVTWLNESERPDAATMAQDIWATTEGVIDAPIDLGGYIAHITARPGDGCVGAAECSNPAAHSLVVAFPTPESLGWSDDVTNMTIAGAMCHELGHIHFYETTGDSDPNHLHTEWYDYNTPGTVCYGVAGMFSSGLEGEN